MKPRAAAITEAIVRCSLAVAAVCLFAEQLPTEVFSAHEGLHATIVDRIVADSKGFVWMPYSEGLARFDGNGFRTFTRADGLPDGAVLDIFERVDGSYWVAVDEQLCLMDPHPGRRRFRCESPKLGAIRRVLEDDRGLWCGTQTGLWRRLPGDSKPWEEVQLSPAIPPRLHVVSRLLRDSRGDIWATIDSELYRFRRNGRIDRWADEDRIATDMGTALAETPGAIWAGSQRHLSRLTIDQQTGEARITGRFDTSNGLPSSYVTDVRFWNGAVWASTFQGLARLLPSGRWQGVGLHPSLNGLPLGGFAIDSQDHLWVGTDGSGAARIPASGFSSFSERDGLGVRKVWAILEDSGGDLIAVTKEEAHYSHSRFDGYRFHADRPRAGGGISFGWSWSHIAVNSRSGGWWLGTGDGVLYYPDKLSDVPVRVGPQSGLPAGGNARVYEDSRGAIWASYRSAAGNELYRRSPGASHFEPMDESPGLPSLRLDPNCPVAFAEDRSGQIWIGMLDGGVVRYRDGQFQQFPPATGAPDQGVRSLLVDRKGRLWIGSLRRGLMRVDQPESPHPAFRVYTREAGLSSNTVLALAEDRGGRIYAATGLSIDRLDPESGRVRAFTTSDGVPAVEFRVAATDRHGTVWFGGDSGLLRLQPREDRRDSPDVLVYSVRVNGQDRLLSDFGEVEPGALSLGSSERQVQVEFGSFRHDLLYQTRLSGIDSDWMPSASRSVHYAALSPGKYEVSIRAVTPDGGVSAHPARVRFEIAAPVWQRWWFLAAVAMVGAGLLLLWHRSQLDRRLAIERVRSRIATDLHDHIGASLSRIAITTEVLKLQSAPASPESGVKLDEIAATARGLVEDMSDIVWSIDPRRDTLRDLVGRLRAFGFGVLEPRKILLTFEAPEESLHRNLSPGQRRQLYLILKEALHNIARHSHAANAALRIRLDGGELHAEIDDDGCGYQQDRPQGLGIHSIEKRAEQLGGKLEIRKRPEGGTRVSLRFPLSARDA